MSIGQSLLGFYYSENGPSFRPYLAVSDSIRFSMVNRATQAMHRQYQRFFLTTMKLPENYIKNQEREKAFPEKTALLLQRRMVKLPKINRVNTHVLNHQCLAAAVGYNALGKLYGVTAGREIIKSWDIKRGVEAFEKEIREIPASTVAITQGGERSLCAAGVGVAESSFVKLWDLDSGRAMNSFSSTIGSLEKVRFSPSLSQVAGLSFDNKVSLWEIENGATTTIPFITKYRSTNIQFSPLGSNDIINCTPGGEVSLTDLRSLEGRMAGRRVKNLFICFDVSPDNLQVAAGGRNGVIDLFDLRKGRVKRIRLQHYTAISEIRYSPCNQLLASASFGGEIVIWDLHRGAVVTTLCERRQRSTEITFPNGVYRSFSYDPIPWVTELAFSPSGDKLAMSALNGVIASWDLT